MVEYLIRMKPWVPSPGPHKQDMTAHACNLDIQEVEAGRLEVQSHPQLHSLRPEWDKSDTFSRKKIKDISRLQS